MVKASQNLKTKQASSRSDASEEVKKVTRHIPKEISEVLWGLAGGRCEFRGCNRPLWKSDVTQEAVKLAERAHIYAFGAGGPRSQKEYRAEGLNSLANLMLLCRHCHKTIDQRIDGGTYTASVLRLMKAEHEARIELVTGIVPSQHSQLVLYSTSIGEHQLLPSFQDAAYALFPDRLPMSDKPVLLGSHDSAVRDHDEQFWQVEASQLESHFKRRVSERLASHDERPSHLSVFAVAPQPLLIKLGVLLGDLVPAGVHQLRRDPSTWSWAAEGEALALQIQEPKATSGPAALVLGLSATVTDDRIHRVLGDDASIWRVSVAEPHNNLIQTSMQLVEWRATLRKLFDRIKAVHGQSETLHLFCALPVSTAVEVGRVRMPKADMPWQIYDQNNQREGFIPALEIT